MGKLIMKINQNKNNSKPLRHIVPNVHPKKFKYCFYKISSISISNVKENANNAIIKKNKPFRLVVMLA